MLRRVLVAAVLLSLAASGRVRAQEAAGADLGTLSGTVLDKATGEPLIDAGVEVVDQGRSARTDIDGKYVIKIKPGTYQVRIFAAGYQNVRIQAITVAAGQVARADASLAPSGQAAGLVVEVVAQASKAAETTQLLKRKKAAVVSDTISAETIEKTVGSDAAAVVSQAPAVTVKDSKYIQVRGLTERYASALLNGSRLPSTDPTRRVVPLDLFPAGFLDSVSIVKSYTPDLPGDFSGGLALLELKDFPETLTYSLSEAIGGNTQSTFQDFNTYRGSTWDYFGYGDEFRRIPAGVPGEHNELNMFSEKRRAQLGRRFRDIWAVDQVTAPPDYGANLSFGDSFGPLGLQVAANYSNGYRQRNRVINNQFTNASGSLDSADIQPRDAVLYDKSLFQTSLGAILTSALKIDDSNRLVLRSVFNRNSRDLTQVGTGFRFNAPDLPIFQQNFRYISEQLAWWQLTGEHRWSWMDVDWRSAYSRSNQDEPDTRFFTQVNGEFVNDSLGGTRLFNTLDEWMSDSAVDFTIPFKSVGLPVTDVWTSLPAKFKWGVAYSFRDRDFEQRRFRYRLPDTDLLDRSLPPDELFAPSNIGPGGFQFLEESQPRDSYTVSQEIAGAYGMFELPIIKDRLRFIGGLRYEYSYIQLDSFSDLDVPLKVIKNNPNPLPAANLVLSPRDDLNFRLGWSRSVSRPDFREISPTLYLAPLGELQSQGNPFLIETEIESYDFRAEWFFSPTELVSLSAFSKTLDMPIEETVVPQSSNQLQSWANAGDGVLYGWEAEARKNFGFVSPWLSYLMFLVNGTWTKSDVQAPRTKVPGLEDVIFVHTSQRRPLQGQAPFIVNAALDFTYPDWGTARIQYNTAGARIALVGSNGLPDIREQRRDELDVVLIAPLKSWLNIPLTATLNVENILNDQTIWSLGQGLSKSTSSLNVPIVNRPGVQGGIFTRYTAGTTIQLVLTHKF